MATIAEEIAHALNHLPPDKQQQVLDFVRSLEQTTSSAHLPLPPGKPVEEFINFRSTLPSKIVDEIERAIEEW